MNKSKSHDLTGKNVSDNPAMEKVIAAQAKMAELREENKALRKDRDQLVSEYTDMVNARKVRLSPSKIDPKGETMIRVCAGDVHGMRCDRDAVNTFLSDVKLLDPDEVVLGGDIVDCGGWLAKHHTIGYVAEMDYSYQEDIAVANEFLDRLQEVAPRAVIHYLAGNHEVRLERWIVDQVVGNNRDAEFLRKHFSPESLLRLKDRGIAYYEREEVHEQGLPRGWIKLGNMHFTHSLSYSKNAARDAAGKTAGNVTYWCTHREDSATIVFPGVGIVKAFNPGCLCSMQPIWKVSFPTEWSQGYGIDVISGDGNFQRIQVPIWRGKSLATAMIHRLSGR